MKYKFEKSTGVTYSEIGQPNPLRWEILFRDGDNFTPQSGLLKCKDFFNDMVSKIVHGKDLSIYGWTTSCLKLNDDVIWMRLHHLNNPELFQKNVLDVLNPKLKEDMDIEISVDLLPNSCALVGFPVALFKNTYLISLSSWVVRLCNYGSKLESFDKALDGPEAKADCAIHSKGVVLVRKWGFKIPKDYQPFWYYSSKEWNGVNKPEPCASVIHNNGVMSWSSAVGV